MVIAIVYHDVPLFLFRSISKNRAKLMFYILKVPILQDLENNVLHIKNIFVLFYKSIVFMISCNKTYFEKNIASSNSY